MPKRGVGVDDGSRHVQKKVTFCSIETHPQAKYNRKFSYGTVVQLCIPRNNCRQSSARCKGLAQVMQKHARRGFMLRYNPDDYLSASLYNGLDYIQYKDGQDIINAGCDDQAGFC